MLPEIPIWLSQLIEAKDVAGLHRFALEHPGPAYQAWVYYGLGECYRKGGPQSAINKKTADEFFDLALQLKPDIYYLKLHAKVGKADCLRVGDQHFKANIHQAYQLYRQLYEQENLPSLLVCRVLCGIADCLREGNDQLPANLPLAYNHFETLLQKKDLPPTLRSRVLMGKVDCLLRTKPTIPHNIRLILAALREVEQMDQNLVPSDHQPWILFTKMKCFETGNAKARAEVDRIQTILRDMPNLPPGIAKYIEPIGDDQTGARKRPTLTRIESSPSDQSPFGSRLPNPELLLTQQQTTEKPIPEQHSYGLNLFQRPKQDMKHKRKFIELSPPGSPQLRNSIV